MLASIQFLRTMVAKNKPKVRKKLIPLSDNILVRYSFQTFETKTEKTILMVAIWPENN